MVQPGEAGFELPDDEIEREGFDGRGCPAPFRLSPGELGLAGGKLAVEDAFGGALQQAGDVEAAEALDADAVDAGGGMRLRQPGVQARRAEFGDGILGAVGGIGLGHRLAGNPAAAFQAFEDRVELAGAHVPDMPEVVGVAEGLEELVTVGGLGFEEPEEDFVRGQAGHGYYSIME